MATSLRKNNTLLTRTWHVNIGLPYGVVFPIGSVRCVACKYRASVRCCISCRFGAGCFSYRPIGSVRAPHRADRKNNTVQKPDIYIPRTAPKRQEKQHRTEARYLHSTHSTEPIGKTTPYRSPIFTFHVRVKNILLFLNEVKHRPPHARNASICKTRSRTTQGASRSRGF